MEIPMFVTINDVNDPGEGGRVVLHASPAFYRSLGMEAEAVQLEQNAIHQVEVIINAKSDSLMEGFPSTKAERLSQPVAITIDVPQG